jgi:hypothetical protein
LAVGGKACQFGYLPSADPRLALNSQLLLTPAQQLDLITQMLSGQATPTQFFSGASGRPAGLLNNWTQLNVEKGFEMLAIPNNNYDCVKRCMANDGKVYDQPVQRLKERTQAAYLMGDFNLDHLPFTNIAFPFGWEIDGNMGYRYIRTRVSGTGMMPRRRLTTRSTPATRAAPLPTPISATPRSTPPRMTSCPSITWPCGWCRTSW